MAMLSMLDDNTCLVDGMGSALGDTVHFQPWMTGVASQCVTSLNHAYAIVNCSQPERVHARTQFMRCAGITRPVGCNKKHASCMASKKAMLRSDNVVSADFSEFKEEQRTN